MHTNETLLDGWEAHRMKAGDALDRYLQKYSKSASTYEITIVDDESTDVSGNRPGLVETGTIKFMFQLIGYTAKYEVHRPMHSGADDFTIVTLVERV